MLRKCALVEVDVEGIFQFLLSGLGVIVLFGRSLLCALCCGLRELYGLFFIVLLGHVEGSGHVEASDWGLLVVEPGWGLPGGMSVKVDGEIFIIVILVKGVLPDCLF